jgi:3alpha(or 20beta)-hydroxysteroid dehydrogenase
MARFAGKVALISGGARGQGAAEARMFAREGARVVIGDVLHEKGRALAQELGANALYVPLDVTKEADWIAAVGETERAFGRLDILVNNAGIFRSTPLETASVEEFTRIYEVNQLGVFLGMKIGVRLMKKTGGTMINISSTAGLRGAPGYAAYVATKFAVRGMTKTAAIEFAPYNIRVNSVHPGLIDTAMVQDEKGDAFIGSYVKGQLIPRRGTANDVTNMVAFLASDESGFSTGTEFICDAGSTTGSRPA